MPVAPRANGTPYIAATKSRSESSGSIAIDGSNASPSAAGGRIVVAGGALSPRQSITTLTTKSSAIDRLRVCAQTYRLKKNGIERTIEENACERGERFEYGEMSQQLTASMCAACR
jgi:hypothetical protein